MVSPELIDQGFELFCSLHKIELSTIKNMRDLMAVAVKIFKRSCRIENSLKKDATVFNGELEEDLEEEVDLDLEELDELTAEQVADKFGRLFKRAAKSYLRGQILTRLLNCRIFFEEVSQIRSIQFCNGQIVKDESGSNPDHNLPWKDLDVITYDRLSVLLSEILRMRASGLNVIIEPDMPLKLISHKIV